MILLLSFTACTWSHVSIGIGFANSPWLGFLTKFSALNMRHIICLKIVICSTLAWMVNHQNPKWRQTFPKLCCSCPLSMRYDKISKIANNVLVMNTHNIGVINVGDRVSRFCHQHHFDPHLWHWCKIVSIRIEIIQ